MCSVQTYKQLTYKRKGGLEGKCTLVVPLSLSLLSSGVEVINHSSQIHSKTIEQRRKQTEEEKERLKVGHEWKDTVKLKEMWKEGEKFRDRMRPEMEKGQARPVELTHLTPHSCLHCRNANI